MTWLLKMFSLSALLEYAAKLALGTKMWDLIRKTVNEVEVDHPNIPGEEKFKEASQRIFTAIQRASIQTAKSLINWGIETAVRILKEKTG